MTDFFTCYIFENVATERLTQYKAESEVSKLVKTLYVDKGLLEKKMGESGLKTQYICEKLALSRTGFWKKINGITPFKVPEIFVLCSLLNINDDDKMKIFYPKEQPESCGKGCK